MEILKIKDWLNTKGKQFNVVFDRNNFKIIAIRIKDNIAFREDDNVFHRISNNKVDNVIVSSFGEDYIHVAVHKQGRAYTVPINELVTMQEFITEVTESILIKKDSLLRKSS